MASPLILGLESIYRRPQKGWWLVQESCRLEALVLCGFAIIVLEHATFPIVRRADYDVAKTDIMPSAWCTASDADHQTDSDVRESYAAYLLRQLL
jgi:hypothetical protein